MGYWDNQRALAERGIDYDFTACLNYNPQGFEVDEVARVLATWEGENDGDDWRWIFQMTDGRYGYMRGGCDYTGWDCLSSAHSSLHSTIAEAFAEACKDESAEVWRELARQLTTAKVLTWSETFDPNRDD
jgi:hypothetical protein